MLSRYIDKLEAAYYNWIGKQSETQVHQTQMQSQQNTAKNKQQKKERRERWTRPTKEEWNPEKKEGVGNDMGQDKMILIAKARWIWHCGRCMIWGRRE